jgi:8-oxo-dGTP pyrophosphatase MutT (NUDIX family)
MGVAEEGRFQVAVGAIIERVSDGKILLVQRAGKLAVGAGIWEFPIGRLKQFEPFDKGLMREVEEETGIRKLKIVMVLSVFTFMRGAEEAENEVKGVVFWCRTTEETARVSGEHDALAWLSIQDAIELVAHDGIKRDLEMFAKIRERMGPGEV